MIQMGVQMTGLEALAAALDRLPTDLQAEAAGIVQRTAEAHLAAVRPRFPARSVTGNMARALTLEQLGPLSFRVYNAAKHAHLYEFGFTHTDGSQVAGHDVYVPEAQSLRSRMVSELEGVVAKAAARSGVLEAR